MKIKRIKNEIRHRGNFLDDVFFEVTENLPENIRDLSLFWNTFRKEENICILLVPKVPKALGTNKLACVSLRSISAILASRSNSICPETPRISPNSRVSSLKLSHFLSFLGDICCFLLVLSEKIDTISASIYYYRTIYAPIHPFVCYLNFTLNYFSFFCLSNWSSK